MLWFLRLRSRYEGAGGVKVTRGSRARKGRRWFVRGGGWSEKGGVRWARRGCTATRNLDALEEVVPDAIDGGTPQMDLNAGPGDAVGPGVARRGHLQEAVPTQRLALQGARPRKPTQPEVSRLPSTRKGCAASMSCLRGAADGSRASAPSERRPSAGHT